MDVDERVSQLDQRRSAPAKPRSRSRVVAAGGLLAALTIAWLFFARSSSPNATPVDPPESSPLTHPDQTLGGARLRALFADTNDCTDIPGAVPRLTCQIDGVHVDARLLGVTDARAAYAKRVRAPIRPGRGGAACARGVAEERSWSRGVEPTVAVGRYSCRIEAGHAALWWTDEHGVLAHAVSLDHDLAGLFRWWAVHRDA